MICRKCKFNNDDNAKFCSNCGTELVQKKKINLNKASTNDNNIKKKLVLKKEEPDTQKNLKEEKIKENNTQSDNEPSDNHKHNIKLDNNQNIYTYETKDTKEFNYNVQNNKNSNSKMPKIIIGLVAIIAIIFISKGFFAEDEDVSSNISNETTVDSNSYSDDTNQNMDDDITLDDDQYDENNSYETSNNLMPYVDSSNTQDYLNYNSPSDFALFSADEYSFGYPKDFYNYAEETDDGYTLWADNGASLTFTVTPRDSYTDMNTEMDELYNYYLDMFYLPETVVYKDDESKDYRRFIVSGYNDSSKSFGNYCFCNVYEDKIEFYQLVTPISGHSKDELSHANYILDTIYRMCSFTGSSYNPRTYDQFINNEMGSKK